MSNISILAHKITINCLLSNTLALLEIIKHITVVVLSNTKQHWVMISYNRLLKLTELSVDNHTCRIKSADSEERDCSWNLILEKLTVQLLFSCLFVLSCLICTNMAKPHRIYLYLYLGIWYYTCVTNSLSHVTCPTIQHSFLKTCLLKIHVR